MPRADVSEDVTSASSSGEGEEEYELDGGLRTHLAWDAGAKQLCLHMRQHVQTKLNVEFKWKGVLNTVTGQHHMRGHLLKSVQTNQPSIQDVYAAARLKSLQARLIAGGKPDREALQQVSAKLRELKVDPDALLPAGLRPLLFADWVMSAGLTYDSVRPGTGVRPTLQLHKAPQALVHSPRTDLLLSAKAAANFDKAANRAALLAGLRLTLYKHSITSQQDLKVSVGLDLATTPLEATVPASGVAWSRAPYLKISENNTSVKLQGGRWTFLYAL